MYTTCSPLNSAYLSASTISTVKKKEEMLTYLKDESVEDEPQKEETEGEIDSNLEMPDTNRRFKILYAGVSAA